MEAEAQHETFRDLVLLEQIEENPDVSQANLAVDLGVAIGTVNWHLKRLVDKGYVKVMRLQRRKLRYIITPEGLALRARLTLDYIKTSFNLYRHARQRALACCTNLKKEGWQACRLIGEGDIADVCRLTCFEQNIDIVADLQYPAIVINGLKVVIEKAQPRKED